MKYINSDGLLKKFDSGALLFQDAVREIVENMPEAVVRCENCKYCSVNYHSAKNKLDYWCVLWDGGVEADGYCYEGEPR